MKIANHKFILFILIVVLLPISSCQDYFNVEPVSVFTNENVFEDVNYTEQVVLGIYQLMTRDEGYSKRLSMYYGVDTDIAMCSGSLDNGRRGIARYAANSGNDEIEKPWVNLYKGIERANICIARIPESKIYSNGSDEDKAKLKRLYGEALALRALDYYELIINWGDVPFKTLPSQAGDNFNLPKTDRDVIYDQLISDLQEAATIVPSLAEVGTPERISKNAIKGLLARIALARGGYSLRKTGGMQRGSDYKKYYAIARDACKEVMESGENHLNPSYENVFKTMCELKYDNVNNEVMFEIGLGQVNSGEVGYYLGMKISDASKYGKADGGVQAIPTYFLSFDTLDLRRDVTVAIYNIDENNQKVLHKFNEIRIAKWRRNWMSPAFPGTDKFTGINWPIIRYSDVLLMYAEAENELNGGPTPAAIDAFEQVRKRAYGDNADKIPATPTDYERFFNEIVKERAWEFGGECIRKYDLIRWNLLDTKLTEMKQNLTALLDTIPPYDKVPRNVVWRQEGEDIYYLNLNQNMDSAQIASRDSIMWPNVTTWGDALNEEYITSIAEFFEPNQKELLPIHQNIIDNNPNLQNDYGY